MNPAMKYEDFYPDSGLDEKTKAQLNEHINLLVAHFGLNADDIRRHFASIGREPVSIEGIKSEINKMLYLQKPTEKPKQHNKARALRAEAKQKKRLAKKRKK